MIRAYSSRLEVSQAAAELFVRTARSAVEEFGRFTVALSGGDAPLVAYALLSRPPLSLDVPWPNTHVFWGDERCVPIHDPRSNAGRALATLLDKVPIPPHQIHPMYNRQPPAEASVEYETILQRHFGSDPPRFDLIFLGLGEDGHTASLFPGVPALEETRRWVVDVTIPGRDMARLTLTAPIINLARNIAFIVYGTKKAPILKRVLDGPSETDQVPARLIAPRDGQLLFLIDNAAGSMLTQVL